MSSNTPLHFDTKPKSGSFQRVRIARSSDIVQQVFQTKTEIDTPILFKSTEKWICDFGAGDFEGGRFSITEGDNNFESFELVLQFSLSKSLQEFTTWYEIALKKQQLCVELTEDDGTERAFNPFDISYTASQDDNHADSSKVELRFKRAYLKPDDDNIISVEYDCDTNHGTVIFASGKPELYNIILIDSVGEETEAVSGEIGFDDLNDGKYTIVATLKAKPAYSLTHSFAVKCNFTTLRINAIREIFDTNLRILGINEITGLPENSGKLVIGINE